MEALSMIEPRNGGLAPTGNRPDSYKAIGISLAVASGLFIGTSFVLKKVGLLRANEKYKEVAGEGYGYLKNAFWWGGMTLMIFGEILNFVAYAFTDAILVTPLGALSVVITAVLSAIFLKERLSMVGKVACFLCIVGAVIIALNGPRESSVANIEDMRAKFITPGFLSYAGVIIVGSVITAWYVGPRWGKKNMLVYISICSWIGGLSVVSTQGLGAAIIAWIRGEPEYKHWFLWVLTTIITSTVLFQGFKGTPPEIATVVLGFLTICSGVVLLQLSKSAKDVPDAALFKGDLDQIQTIGEQEQPESEPKADAIRGTAAIMRRISKARVKMEAEELKRLHEEKMADDMAPIGEDGLPEYEWDGLRRRKTLAAGIRERAATSPPLPTPSVRAVVTPTNAHPPLGMSRFPTEDDEPQEAEANRRPFFASITGTVGGRPRTSNTLPAYREEYAVDRPRTSYKPVPLTRIVVPQLQQQEEAGTDHGQSHGLDSHDTEYHGAGANASATRSAIDDEIPPPPPPHTTRRQFSFNRVFRRNLSPSEEERVGLVKEDG
ncbi:hypothetical protein E4U60_001326 [Claviceps pazoutovae]|uniref:DUF803 domain membrane protein n=1 Tax=Claviceps pazoutovae TaxID=1649127 RepID=A0A9P7MDD8_9HYPO|nr:hypothetical protein E4U60_001326 [Claviceps pazoutovae]